MRQEAREDSGLRCRGGHAHAPQSYTGISPVSQSEKWMGWILPILGSSILNMFAIVRPHRSSVSLWQSFTQTEISIAIPSWSVVVNSHGEGEFMGRAQQRQKLNSSCITVSNRQTD